MVLIRLDQMARVAEPHEIPVAGESTDLITFASKGEMLAKSKQFWNPGKTQFWMDSGVPLVIDRREGYFIYDVEGKRLIDVHLNGGTYNLGHRNPEVTAAGLGRHAAFRHREPPFPLADADGSVGGARADRAAGTDQGDVRQRWTCGPAGCGSGSPRLM
jgi:hypothetical protein